MRELFNVDFHNDGGFTMNLKNGKVNIPGKQDCYAVSTGCGSGKTECCKSIIRQRHNEGILYCVDTISELDKMYRWIMDNKDNIGINESDVIAISSDPRHRNYTTEYRSNPEILMSKQIVLITHVRFWTDLISYFLIYRPGSKDYGFNGDFKSLMGRDDLRRYVMFDETPLFITPFFSMPKFLLGTFTEERDGDWECKSRSDMDRYYRKFIQGTDIDPFQNTDYAINRIKRDVVFDLLPEYLPRWIDSDDVSIRFTPLCLCQPVIKTHILIMEGAGNVLFRDSRYYKLIDVPDKYNCKVHFEEFRFDLKRREGLDKNAYSCYMGWLAKRLKSNQRNGRKTLVVVWMNQGPDVNDTDRRYYDRVVSELGRRKIDRNLYRVIYYGSSESKSTNEFRDFSEVILCGKWGIVNSETSRFNQNYGVDIKNPQHKMWAYIQLLCRIGIRMHDGGEFTVCYSSDFSRQWIGQLAAYFENKNVTGSACIDTDPCPQWLDEKMTKAGLGVLRKKEIVLLGERLGDNMLLPIQQNAHATVDISLDDIFRTVKRSRKKKGEYKRLIRDLSKLGVSLNIIRNTKGRQKQPLTNTI